MWSFFSTHREHRELRKVNKSLYSNLVEVRATKAELHLDVELEKQRLCYLKESAKVDQTLLDRLGAMDGELRRESGTRKRALGSETAELAVQVGMAGDELKAAKANFSNAETEMKRADVEMGRVKRRRQQLEEELLKAEAKVAERRVKVEHLLEFYECWKGLGDSGVTRLLMEEIRREYIRCVKVRKPSDEWSYKNDCDWDKWREMTLNPLYTEDFSTHGLSPEALEMMRVAVDFCSGVLHGNAKSPPACRLGDEERVIEAACRVFEECQALQVLQAQKTPRFPGTPVNWEAVPKIFNYYYGSEWTEDKITEVRAKIASQSNVPRSC